MPEELQRIALSFRELAREEASTGYRTKDMRHVREAAEKAWLASLQAVGAAMRRHGRGPEPGPLAHRARTEFKEGSGRGDLADRLRVFADTLHESHSYIGEVPLEPGMDLCLDEVEAFLHELETAL
jgi:hypothetical protein